MGSRPPHPGEETGRGDPISSPIWPLLNLSNPGMGQRSQLTQQEYEATESRTGPGIPSEQPPPTPHDQEPQLTAGV